MSVDSRVTVITKLDPLTPAEGAVALLLEHAPDASLPFPNIAAELHELIGAAEETKARAWRLTQTLIAGEPAFEGVYQLHVMEEIIIRALENIFYAVHLDRWLQGGGFTECFFRAPSPYIQRLRSIQAISGSQYKIVSPPAESISLAHKVRRRVQNKGLGGLGDSLLLGAQRFFPNAARYLSALPNARRSRHKGGWWFYSTAYTFTNIGLAYEQHLPQPFHYLIDSSETGQRPLQERDREFFDIYAWASPSDLSSGASLDQLRPELLERINSAPLDGDDAIARAALLQSDAFQTYLGRILPLTCFHSKLSARFLDEVSPDVVVVGNAAFEGPLLQLARARGIPTVLLQHGILGDYYQLMDQPADTLLVRGEFWKEFVAEKMRARARILNVPEASGAATPSPHPQRSKLLFLTSVDTALTHAHESDLRDILGVLLQVCASHRRTLVVRVHPMETIGYYRVIVERILSELGLRCDVEYSQGPGLEALLAQSSAAITYSSTVFLDCLRLGIPIISFGWHDFAYKALIEQHQVFRFANGLAELRLLVEDGINGRLAPSSDYARFLAPTSKSELAAFFESLRPKSLAQPTAD